MLDFYMSNISVGFIGLGSLGLPIDSNLVSAGFALKVHTRSRIAETDRVLQNAHSFSSPRDLAKGCQFIFLCVSDDEAVEEVLFGSKGFSFNAIINNLPF